MSYRHIENLYQNQAVLMFREVFALEKIHGTSAHVAWQDGALRFFSGGEKYANFVALFNPEALTAAFIALGHPAVTVYGEAYGGKCQGMRDTYGPTLRFIAFEVQIGETWLSVPNAEDVARKVGIEFVDYRRVPATVEALDAERDRPSTQATRNGAVGLKPREGIVIRPLVEVTLSNDERVMAKHKRDEFRETKALRVPGTAPEVLVQAEGIAVEWVTPMRLEHVMDALKSGLMRSDLDITHTGQLIAAMVEDVEREAGAEIVTGRKARMAIGTAARKLFHAKLRSVLV